MPKTITLKRLGTPTKLWTTINQRDRIALGFETQSASDASEATADDQSMHRLSSLIRKPIQ
jgi:hypothetical protein